MCVSVSVCVCEQWALGRSRRGNNKRIGYLSEDMVSGLIGNSNHASETHEDTAWLFLFIYFFLFFFCSAGGKNKRRRMRKKEEKKKEEERTGDCAPLVSVFILYH